MKIDLKRMLYWVSLMLPDIWIFNYSVAAAYFIKGNRRLPRSPSAANATINDFIFYRMIGKKWSILQQFCVDKEYSKIFACYSEPLVKIAKTISVFSIDKNGNVDDFIEWLKPFRGRRLVAKPTHGSGRVLFLDRQNNDQAINDFFAYSQTNFFYIVRETQYKKLERKIIIEENISGADNINDYKFFCARGRALYCQVDTDRFIEHKRGIYSIPGFENIPIRSKFLNVPDNVQRPGKFDEMIQIASKMSKDFDFVRIDLYEVEGGIYFGEYTFSPDAACANISDETVGIEFLRMVHNSR